MGKQPKWVVYKDIKEKVTLEMVLRRYGLLEHLKPSGHNLVGSCPIHGGSNPRQFSANLERNLYNCFGDCQAGGNVLDFVARMEEVSVREAALLLKDWFPECAGQNPAPGENRPSAKRAKKESRSDRGGKPQPAQDEPRTSAEASTPEAVNPPLPFALKNLDPDHPFLADRGISRDTALFFGLGFCGRGLLKDRIAIPIHNERGELVAYCGRAVTPEQAEAEGKYKLPPKFVKSAVVYNLHRQTAGQGPLIIVESYLSVYALHQAGFPHAVALMGSSLSAEQAELIASCLGPAGQAVLLFDADDSGQAGAEDGLKRLGRRLFVQAPVLPDGVRKPHQLPAETLKALLGPLKLRS